MCIRWRFKYTHIEGARVLVLYRYAVAAVLICKYFFFQIWVDLLYEYIDLTMDFTVCFDVLCLLFINLDILKNESNQSL